MNRIKVPTSTQQKMEDVFDNLQTKIESNIIKRFDAIFDTGIISDANSYSGQVLTTGLKLEVTSENSIKIYAGKGICPNGEIVYLSSDIYLNFKGSSDNYLVNSAVVDNFPYYLIKIKYITEGKDPITAANAFLYKSMGGDGTLSRFTSWDDSYIVVATGLEDCENVNWFLPEYTSTNELVIGIIKYSSGQLVTNTSFSASIDSTVCTYPSVNGVADLRSTQLFKLKSNNYYDVDVVRKDRSSVGVRMIQGSLEVLDTYYGSKAVLSNSLTTSGATIVGHNLANLTLSVQDSDYTFAARPTSSGNPGLTIQTSASSPIKILNGFGETLLYMDTYNKRLGINKVPTNKTVEINGDLDVTGNIHMLGFLVALDESAYIAPRILNSRSTRVYGMHEMAIDEGAVASGQFSYENNSIMGNIVKVDLKWGYDALQGTGGTQILDGRTVGTFTINNADAGWGEDYFAGQFLYIPASMNMRIIGNAATSNGTCVLYVYKYNGDDWDGTDGSGNSISVTGTNYAKIHPNAEDVSIRITPYVNGVLQPPEKAQEYVIRNGEYSEIKIGHTVELQVASKYKVSIEGKRGKYKTTTKGEFTIETIPTAIPDDGTIVCTTTKSGIKVKVAGWEGAEALHIIYNFGVEPKFDDPNVMHAYISCTSVDLAVTEGGLYYIKVRPEVANYAVAPHKSASQTAGTGGNLPNNGLVATLPIKHTTYQGTIKSVEAKGTRYYVFLDLDVPLYHPAGQTEMESKSTDADMKNMILTDSLYNKWVITDVYDRDALTVRPYSDAEKLITAGPEPGVFDIGVGFYTVGSKESRYIADVVVKQDTLLTGIEVVPGYTLSGDPVTLRVYQKNDLLQANADHIVITEGFIDTSNAADLVISSSQGGLIFVVDLFDPDTTTPKNTGSFIGTVNIYGKPWSANPQSTNQYPTA